MTKNTFIDQSKKKAIVLASGGLDSTTVLEYVRDKQYNIMALSFVYGQRHDVEICAIKRIISSMSNIIEHKIITIDLQTFGGSAITDNNLEIPDAGHKEKIPITYVPARNTIFLAYAMAYAEVNNIYDIFIGVNSVDYSGYPDCRPEYIKKFEEMANLGTVLGTRDISGKKITIHAPLIALSKEEIIQLGNRLGVDYSMTVSCYNPSVDSTIVKACGKCDACILRRDGFYKANLKDPTNYM